MWIFCLAEDSLETSSLIFFWKKKKKKKKQWKNVLECRLPVAVVIGVLMVKLLKSHILILYYYES